MLRCANTFWAVLLIDSPLHGVNVALAVCPFPDGWTVSLNYVIHAVHGGQLTWAYHRLDRKRGIPNSGLSKKFVKSSWPA